MKLGNASRRVARIGVVLRNNLSERYLRIRNLRIVKCQPTDFRYFQEEVHFPDTHAILQVARECFLCEGYYPISFSWPRKFEAPQGSKSRAVSTTIPYVPYSFQDSADYYASYTYAVLAITQKKGGWDCFRHLEIIGAGCVPLFLHAGKIPKYTMIHYPKQLLKTVGKNYRKRLLLPSGAMSIGLIKYAR
jgi:hypothetical protein